MLTYTYSILFFYNKVHAAHREEEENQRLLADKNLTAQYFLKIPTNIHEANLLVIYLQTLIMQLTAIAMANDGSLPSQGGSLPSQGGSLPSQGGSFLPILGIFLYIYYYI
jgi:hypothetical protein